MAAAELSECEIFRLAEQAHDKFLSASAFESEGQVERAIIEAVKLGASRNLAAPTYHETAKRPPTAEDGNAAGAVLAWKGDRWTDMHWDQDWSNTRGDLNGPAQRFPYWLPQPPAPVQPVSAEDAAFDAALTSHGHTPSLDADDRVMLRRMFDAALAFAATRKPA